MNVIHTTQTFMDWFDGLRDRSAKQRIFILLAGGDKSTQAVDIETAIALARQLKG